MDMLTILIAAAKQAQVPAALLIAICSHETKINNVVVKNDGNGDSIGYCMVKHTTAQMMGYKGKAYGKLRKSKLFPGSVYEAVGAPEGLMDPETNARYAALYLKKQYDRYGGDFCMAAAAYNAGKFMPSRKNARQPANRKYVDKIISVIGDTPEIRDLFNCRHSRKPAKAKHAEIEIDFLIRSMSSAKQ
jgi:soluble lytic murein transglycosylase-like protein